MRVKVNAEQRAGVHAIGAASGVYVHRREFILRVIWVMGRARPG